MPLADDLFVQQVLVIGKTDSDAKAIAGRFHVVASFGTKHVSDLIVNLAPRFLGFVTLIFEPKFQPLFIASKLDHKNNSRNSIFRVLRVFRG